jgi:glucosamine--fructose-6-phosphate aminotransferase (isomerizing)
MCGIVAVLARPSRRPAPDPGAVVDHLAQALALLGAAGARPDDLGEAARRVEVVDAELHGPPGVACLLEEGVADKVAALCAQAQTAIAEREAALDAGAITLDPALQEAANAAVVRLKDAWWAVQRDRLGSARSIADLVPPGLELRGSALDALWSIEVSLAGIDRLEVRGRDSAGIHVLVAGHGLDLAEPGIAALLGPRVEDHLFTSLAARVPDGCLSLVYKAAAEIGELGDNVASLRAAVRSDPLLALALRQAGSRVTVLGHTRWASVGIISQANAHPVNSEELGAGPDRPYVTAALNGDVDNHMSLRFSESLRLPDEVTTDAKVIPAIVSHRLAEGVPADDAFASTVARFEGSVAIAASAAASPDRLHLALKGSGQGMCIGLTEDAFVVASEPYGLVEQTPRFVRLDGEGTGGQVAVLDRDAAGTLEGVRVHRYDGTPLALAPRDVHTAQVTTRDIDRASFPHFLLKELNESPGSFRKTLRGRIAEGPGGALVARLGEDTLPPSLVAAWAAGRIRTVLVIGQGTAAVAGQATAAAFERCVGRVAVRALPATELSGFGLSDDMSDTLVVAISQSGTTTDTNRTVDLARHRGAHVVAVVNRRSSDLVGKAHGVLYTSDGRDIEMSVASTKAFYAQVAAGWLLAAALGALPGPDPVDPARTAAISDALSALREMPRSMERVLAERPLIGRAAGSLAPARRYWAIVGSGPDRVAATEVRIKLSELCYKAIAADAIEDKKHIDLSSEPLILVCAAALSGPIAADVAKEIAIYRAHKAAPVVVARRSETQRFANALEVIPVDDVHPDLSFVLSAMVGHLFGYEAALAIDALALPLRAARASIEATTGGDVDPDPQTLERLTAEVGVAAQPFLDGVRSGEYNGTLEASTAVALSTLLRYASGLLPLETYELESGKVGTPAAITADLLAALTSGIDELTRPIDAIKHQAKTVTVGISRSEDELLELPLVKCTLAAGASPDRLGYRALRTLGVLDRAVEDITGWTRYRITETGDSDPGRPGQPLMSIEVVEQSGSAAGIASRTRVDNRLQGTKHRAADEREVTVARGRRDGRTVVLVPEVEDGAVVGMTLLHVRFADVLAPGDAKAVLAGYRGRWSALADAVTETEPSVDEEILGRVPIVDLLTEPVYVLAERWRTHPS